MGKRDLSPGDRIAYKNVGYGVTSYEGPDVVIKKVKNMLYTETFDRENNGMVWSERDSTWVFDGGLGMRTLLVDPNDPTIKKELDENAS